MILASSKKIMVMYENGSKTYVLTVKQFHSMTMQANATSECLSANTDTHARFVGRTTEEVNVRQSKAVPEPQTRCPHYTQGLLWDDNNGILSSTAQWSLMANPVLSVPYKEYNNSAAVNTIHSNPHLFKITTPIKVDHFKELLANHSNPALVKSVCCSLCTGFWPQVNMHHQFYPTTWDNSHCPIKTKEEEFIEAQISKEVLAERYSEDFRPDLLPEMYCSPIHTAPKLGMDTFWLISNQSAGKFFPNSMIDCDNITGTCMNRIKLLGASL